MGLRSIFKIGLLKGEPPHPSVLRVRYARSFSKRKEPRDHFWTNPIARWFGMQFSDRLFIGVIRFDGGHEDTPPTSAALREAGHE